jgi:TPR repeat protein
VIVQRSGAGLELVADERAVLTLINALALNDDYAEAICDLGQFYEYGIGIDKDIDKAKLLYKSAMESGIKRAVTHYERVNKENKGLFSFLKK